MSDKYYTYRLFNFLRQVACNNNREWFHGHKEEYDELRAMWLDDLDKLLSVMSVWEPDLASQTAKTCAYRFYRDTRFSLDKSPYKTFFSAAISPYGRKTRKAGYYLHMGIDGDNTYAGSGLYGGIWCPDAPMLNKLRRAIVDNIEEFEVIINDNKLTQYFPSWIGESLKSIPKGWDKNHPQAELLKLKEYGRFLPCNETFFKSPDWIEIAAERFSRLKPFVDFLNYSIDEDTSY